MDTTVSAVAALTALICGGIASVIGGAAGGVMVGGKSLGNQLAAFMGGFYGPLAGIAGVAIGLLVLKVIG
jgi:hypothetical protein